MVPRASSAVTFNIPALIVVAPVYVFVPLKVKVPDPTFVNAPAPSNTPENSVVELSLPADKVWLEAMLIVPAPAIDQTVSVASKSYVAPLATVTAVLSDNVPVTVNVPAEIVVVPV